MSTPIRVLIADDQKVVREGLAMVLGLLRDVEVVGAASDGDEAVALAGDLHPDVILMDLRMPRCDGVEATRILRERQPGTKVVILTTYADDRSVLDALRAGRPRLPHQRRRRDRNPPGTPASPRRSSRHRPGSATSPRRSHRQRSRENPPPPPRLPDGLTPRETEVLRLIATGLSNSEIAEHLVISEGTVKSHINRLLMKIHARDRGQAVAYAYQHGLGP